MDRHHNAPPLAERLELDHVELTERLADVLDLVPPELRAIGTDEEAGEYAETAKCLKSYAADIEKARKREKDQILKDGRTVDAFFATFADPVKAAIDKLIGALNLYQRAKLEAERVARDAAEKKAREEAALFDEPAPVVAAPVVVKEAARVTSISGVKATASRKWVHEVTDPTAVPRQYLMVNDAAIKAAVAGGLREISGVRIYEDVRTSIR